MEVNHVKMLEYAIVENDNDIKKRICKKHIKLGRRIIEGLALFVVLFGFTLVMFFDINNEKNIEMLILYVLFMIIQILTFLLSGRKFKKIEKEYKKVLTNKIKLLCYHCVLEDVYGDGAYDYIRYLRLTNNIIIYNREEREDSDGCSEYLSVCEKNDIGCELNIYFTEEFLKQGIYDIEIMNK